MSQRTVSSVEVTDFRSIAKDDPVEQNISILNPESDDDDLERQQPQLSSIRDSRNTHRDEEGLQSERRPKATPIQDM